METSEIFLPIKFFGLALLFSFLTIMPSSQGIRSAACCAHITCVTAGLRCTGMESFPPIAVPFSIGLALHTISLLVEAPENELGKAYSCAGAQAVIQKMINIRRIPPAQHTPATGSISRVTFVRRKTTVVIVLYILQHITPAALAASLASMPLSATHLAPQYHTLLLPASRPLHHLVLRVLFAANWTWDTYASLNIWHNVGALIFVTCLGWDQASDWPPLFGRLLDAYTLRRFWGCFWQRLHVKPFQALLPHCVRRRKILRALCLFTFSAFFHALVDWVVFRANTLTAQIWFFSCCYTVCLAETLIYKLGRNRGWQGMKGFESLCVLGRGLGYIWVLVILVVTVAKWQFPLAHSIISRADKYEE